MLLNYPSRFGTISPDDFEDLSVWIDPDDGTTVTTSGSTVTGLENKQGVSSLVNVGSPELVTVGGLDWVRFDGSSDVLQGTTVDHDTEYDVDDGPYTMFLIVSYTTTDLNESILNKGAPNLYRFRTDTSTAGALDAIRKGPSSGTISNAGGSGNNDGNPHILCAQFDDSSLKLRFFIDGTEINAPGEDVSTADDISNASNSRVNFGANWNGSTLLNHWAGDMGEFLLYKRSLPGAQRSAITQYLADKWGV